MVSLIQPFAFTPFLLRLRKAAAVSVLGILAGCAAIAPAERAPDAVPSAPRLYHEAVAMTGRLSIRYQVNGEDQALHGSFTWSQRPQRILVSLLSPLGQTLATIESTPAGSVLRQPGQPPRTASDVDALTAQTLGWPLPVAGLRDWLQGFADIGGVRRQIASPETTTETILQDGWQLHYASWSQDAAPLHPKRLDLQRTTPQAGEVELRLIIDSLQPL